MTERDRLFEKLLLMVILLLIAFFVVSKASAQTPVLTNKDLNKPMTASVPATIDTETWQGLVARQFVGQPHYDGPRILSTTSSGPSMGPWDWPIESPRRRLDGTLLGEQPPEWYWSIPQYPTTAYPLIVESPERRRGSR